MAGVTSGRRKENGSADRAKHSVEKTQPPPTEALKRAPRAPSVCPGHWGWKRTSRKGVRERAAPAWPGPPRCVSEERAQPSPGNSQVGVLWPDSQVQGESQLHPTLLHGVLRALGALASSPLPRMCTGELLGRILGTLTGLCFLVEMHILHVTCCLTLGKVNTLAFRTCWALGVKEIF